MIKIKNKMIPLFVITFLILLSYFTVTSERNFPSNDYFITADPIIADHTIVNMIRLNQTPESAIIAAKNTLHIAYQHTSHGSQIITGMNGLPAFKEGLGGTEGLYDWNDGPLNGSLDIDDYFSSGDLGNPDRTTWADLTRTYLDNPAHSDVNVVMWSWCGQVSGATEENIETYLTLMSELEDEYPSVKFVYMTGHTDGTGEEGNLNIRNNQIREYCLTHRKILYDFADIESYDPDGNYFLDKAVNDECYYDSDDDGSRDANWAIEWQDTHPGEWYDCSPAHTRALNGNLKAYAAWWLWARLAGWVETPSTTTPTPTPTPTPTISTTPSGNGAFIGGFISLGVVCSVAFSVILLVEKRNKYMKK